MPPPARHVLAGVAAVSLSVLAACGSGDKTAAQGGGGKGTDVAVTATDTTCEVARKDLPAGAITFKVTNKGAQATELEIFKADGKVVSERENIGPGTGVDLTVQLSAGTYKVLCSPGMTGKGPAQEITVRGHAASAGDARLDTAVSRYRAYAEEQVEDTLAATRKFVAAVKERDVAAAKALYAPSRIGWERVEPVAESFGDIDPKVDLREADLKQGQTWTGWHRLEKALWVRGSVDGEGRYADRLVADLAELEEQVEHMDITPTTMANGAKELLDEVATSKVTGEEEAFSHTDLTDFKANVDGAEKVYRLLEPVVRDKDAALVTSLDGQFANVKALLAGYREGDGYVSYDTVRKADRRKFSDAVNALAEPLSKLAGVVAG